MGIGFRKSSCSSNRSPAPATERFHQTPATQRIPHAGQKAHSPPSAIVRSSARSSTTRATGLVAFRTARQGRLAGWPVRLLYVRARDWRGHSAVRGLLPVQDAIAQTLIRVCDPRHWTDVEGAIRVL